MVSFVNFSTSGGSPIYRQIVLFVKRKIVSGDIVDGDELPSRRMLSALLGVNPNTIQKSYRILETEGIIESRSGAKSVIIVTDEHVTKIRDELLAEDALDIIQKMREMGIKKAEAHMLIDKYWD